WSFLRRKEFFHIIIKLRNFFLCDFIVLIDDQQIYQAAVFVDGCGNLIEITVLSPTIPCAVPIEFLLIFLNDLVPDFACFFFFPYFIITGNKGIQKSVMPIML